MLEARWNSERNRHTCTCTCTRVMMMMREDDVTFDCGDVTHISSFIRQLLRFSCETLYGMRRSSLEQRHRDILHVNSLRICDYRYTVRDSITVKAAMDLLSGQTTRQVSVTSRNVKVSLLFFSQEGHTADPSVLRDARAPCASLQAFRWNVPIRLDAKTEFKPW